jgi:hypothetical protein
MNRQQLIKDYIEEHGEIHVAIRNFFECAPEELLQ